MAVVFAHEVREDGTSLCSRSAPVDARPSDVIRPCGKCQHMMRMARQSKAAAKAKRINRKNRIQARKERRATP